MLQRLESAKSQKRKNETKRRRKDAKKQKLMQKTKVKIEKSVYLLCAFASWRLIFSRLCSLRSLRLIFATLCFLILSLCTGCTQGPEKKMTTQWIHGRNDELTLDRPLLYRAVTQADWIRKDPLEGDSLNDTTKSICEFYIRENDQSIRITLHTFPIRKEFMSNLSISSISSISPQAQVARWKDQFEEIDLISVQVKPVSQGGFSGLFFEGQGKIKGISTQVMGWSMQLAPIYARQLSQSKNPQDFNKCADYTIKASGPPELLNKHRRELMAFSKTFELIDELPFSP